MNRTGGNITGVSGTVMLGPKRLELFARSHRKRIAFCFLMNRNNPHADVMIDQFRKAALSLGVGLTISALNEESELETAFRAMAQQGTDALLVEADPAMERVDG